MLLSTEIKNRLIKLAEKYENDSFLTEDPSQYLRWYKNDVDVEVASFIAAVLSFGNRKQFIPKIMSIFTEADKTGTISTWIKNGEYKNFCKYGDKNESSKKFYRFYSYEDMCDLFDCFKKILDENLTFGEFLKKQYENGIEITSAISTAFQKAKIVPKGKLSANKRVHLFLRWMVRESSPVDLGLWTWYDPSNLIIPLDTHVLQESKKLGLVEKNATASLKTAQKITEKLKEIWRYDPCKGDFALFGLGVESDNQFLWCRI